MGAQPLTKTDCLLSKSKSDKELGDPTFSGSSMTSNSGLGEMITNALFSMARGKVSEATANRIQARVRSGICSWNGSGSVR
jgi:hypothetical protein